MARPALEVSDILRVHGDAYARAHAGHLKVRLRMCFPSR
jgi:hypothetical protein